MYKISLLLLSLFLVISCRKNEPVLPPSPPAAAAPVADMGGTRLWHRSYYDYHQYHTDTVPVTISYTYPDTSFALTIVNDTTVLLKGKNYVYDRTDTARRARFFGTIYTAYEYNAGEGVAYFYERDSLVWLFRIDTRYGRILETWHTD